MIHKRVSNYREEEDEEEEEELPLNPIFFL